jgi:hypothetical protein
MKKTLTVLAIATLVCISSCKSAGDYKELAANVSEQSQVSEVQSKNDKVETPNERKLIKQGEISFQTADVNETKSLISNIVEGLEGYIAKDNIIDSKDKITHRLVIRVPAERFDQLLTKIAENAEQLESKSIDVLDVTEEYIDVKARINTKKELENRYKELLKQAKTVEDILAIEKEMGTLRTEIESVEGRLRYLKDQVGYSTLTVEYYQKKNSSFNFSSKLVIALATGWDWLLSFLIGILHIWPFILLIAGGLYLAFYFDKKKKKK